MSVTLLTVAALKSRAETHVAGYLSWGTGSGTSLISSETSHLRLRGYKSNVDSFAAECAALIAATGYSGLDPDLKTDVESIQSAMTAVASTLATLIADVDTLFAALPSGRKTEIATAHGLGTGGIVTVDDAWATVPQDLKNDLVQHELVDSGTVSSVLAAVAIA